MLPSVQRKSGIDILKDFLVFHIIFFIEKSEFLFLILIVSNFIAQTDFPFAEAFGIIKWIVLIGFVAINLINIGLKSDEKIIVHKKLYKAVGLFIFYLVFNSLLSIDIGLSLSKTAILTVSFLLWFLILPNYFKKKEQFLGLVTYLFYFFAAFLFLNIFLTVIAPGTFFKMGIYTRYSGIFENANTLGMFSFLSVVFILYKIKTGTRFEKILSFLMSLMVIANLLLTVSRSSMLGTFIVVTVFLYFYYRKLFYVEMTGIAVVVSILFLFPIIMDLLRLTSNPFSYREQLFTLAITNWKESILFGKGFGTAQILTSNVFTFLQHGYNLLIVGKHFHNAYIELLTETGIIGVLSFFPVLVIITSQIKKVLKAVRGKLRLLTLLFSGLIVGFLIQNLFESALFAPGNGITFLFWSFCGLLLSLPKITDSENESYAL